MRVKSKPLRSECKDCNTAKHLGAENEYINHPLIPEERADGFAVVDTTDRFGKDGANLENLKLGAQAFVVLLRDAVGDNDLV